MMHPINVKTELHKVDRQPTIIPVLCVIHFMYIMHVHAIYIVHLGNIACILTITPHRCSDCDLFALVFDYVPTCIDTRLHLTRYCVNAVFSSVGGHYLLCWSLMPNSFGTI